MGDTHSKKLEGTPRQAAIPCESAVLDQALTALLADLHAKRLLDQTLVVLRTEFGRTPRINDNDVRNQHKVFICLLAAAGIGLKVHRRSWARR